MPVGRLDQDSEGLLLLTTDGKLSYEVTSGGSVEKQYYAQLDGAITDDSLKALASGLTITRRGNGLFKTRPCLAFRIPPPCLPERGRRVRDDRHGPTSWISVTLTEGKFRQVRKMTAAVGFPTLRLVRVRVGPVALGALAPGKIRELDGEQLWLSLKPPQSDD